MLDERKDGLRAVNLEAIGTLVNDAVDAKDED
jgi:hypothetical protein